jgi:IS30 family transposase
MNYLEMSLQQSIVTLRSHGWSFRRIARELDIRRETVSKYVRQHESNSKPAKVPPALKKRRSQNRPICPLTPPS